VTVYVGGYQALSILHGGPLTQIRETVKGLRERGVDARIFDPWNPPQFATGDIFHLFAANIGTYHLAREIHALGLPMVVSPITFSRHSPLFVRAGLKVSRLAQKIGPGIWSDYALCADICGWAVKILPNTHAEAEFLQKGYGIPPRKVTVIPNGVDARFAQADPSLFERTYNIRNFILNVGHIGHERKNVLALIRVLATIDAPAVIIGRVIRGPYGEACVREAAKHKHILLIEGLDNSSEMLVSAYAACDTFVLPSYFETPGIAALEAGLAGAKIVITRHGGTAEYFGDHAWYVEPSSASSIRRGIMKALEGKKDAALRDRILRNFTWKVVAERTAAAYGELGVVPAQRSI
jgi:glycosyltransferase involved in cell wall biosynthesis